MGYSSLDIAMLLIAALVILAASRVPVKTNGNLKKNSKPGFKRGRKTTHAIS
ncbi:hypothetical protein [Mucilaginibacter sp. AK015]|uniref:hypothetical protein n=1 Tax=Mucilaginibacter sp. AK015 TaxID=2723072 RepID=UPI00160F48E2|nr:hypothetical protein [Mucilaginibacter sp. AK015]MBB5395003.1 hypothetical protein [Mucilaginibacter sp. AK015]